MATAGDKNSKFFPSKASQRQGKNEIKGLEDEARVWQSENEDICGIIERYFSDIFSSSQPSQADISRITDFVLPVISQWINEQLLYPFSAEDIRRALFSMGGNKAPGPNGLKF